MMRGCRRSIARGAAGLLIMVGVSAHVHAQNTISSADYVVRLAVKPARGVAIQRLSVPAQALVALQTTDLRDLRIVNAEGRAVPMALIPAPPPTATPQRQHLASYPVFGTALGSPVQATTQLTIRLDKRNRQRIAEVRVADGAGGGAHPTAVIGYLFDARAVASSASALALDLEVPSGRLVQLKVAVSSDLQHWQTVAQSAVYQAPPTGEASAARPLALGSSQIALPDLRLKDQYLLLNWEPLDAAEPPTLTLRSAEVLTQTRAAPSRVRVPLGPIRLSSPHTFQWSLPFATPIAALDIVAQGDNELVPIQLLGRVDTDARTAQPWTPIARTVIYRLGGAQLAQNGPIELAEGHWRQLKVEADARTAGFTDPPQLYAEFDPIHIVFVATGSAPFTLLAGRHGDEKMAPAFLPLTSVIPGYQAGQEAALAQAVVEAPEVLMAGATVQDDRTPTRTIVLWAVLLVGVLVLVAMGWTLLKGKR